MQGSDCPMNSLIGQIEVKSISLAFSSRIFFNSLLQSHPIYDLFGFLITVPSRENHSHFLLLVQRIMMKLFKNNVLPGIKDLFLFVIELSTQTPNWEML